MPVLVPPTPTTTGTTLDWIEATRRHLGSGQGETLNQITAVNATQTSVTLSRILTNIQPGTVLSVGLEQMYVWAVTDAGSKTLEVMRGYGASMATAHAAGELVRIGNPHTDFAIFRALNDELSALSGEGLYSMRTLTLTGGSASTYDLTPDVADIYAVLADEGSTRNAWPEVTSWTLRPSQDTGEFSSGNVLRIDSPITSGATLHVLYRAPLGQLSGLDDNTESASGLLPSALDLPPIGAAWRLSMPEEVQRNQTHRQGDSRRPEEVPPGAKLRAPAGLAQMRAMRVKAERNRLAALWPSRSNRADGLGYGARSWT